MAARLDVPAVLEDGGTEGAIAMLGLCFCLVATWLASAVLRAAQDSTSSELHPGALAVRTPQV